MSNALEALKSLSKKGAVSKNSPVASEATTDPAILNAKKDKTVVRLGYDDNVSGTVAKAYEVSRALDRLEGEWKIYESELRDYGATKRQVWNRVMRDSVTTVAVPFKPEGHEEFQYLRVSCSNKYSVNKETVLKLKQELGSQYGKLFKETEEKVLKPNVEGILRGILQEAGMSADDLEQAMAALFETELTITTQKDYEERLAEIDDENTRNILNMAVVRASPGLKFPD
jgi:hypothetical protein